MKHYWKIILALAVILLAGTGIGFGLGKQTTKRHFQNRNIGGPRPEMWQDTMLRRLTGNLDLTDEQKAEIRPLLRQTSEKMHEHRRRAMQESWREIRVFYQHLETHLDEEQQAKLKATRDKIRERVQRAGGKPTIR